MSSNLKVDFHNWEKKKKEILNPFERLIHPKFFNREMII